MIYVLLTLYFFSGMFPEFLNSNDETEGNETKTRCTCGKNVKDPSKMACTSSKCPCNRKSQACSRKCRCFNCKNKNNAATEGGRQLGETRKRKRGCTCGNTLNKEDKGRGLMYWLLYKIIQSKRS